MVEQHELGLTLDGVPFRAFIEPVAIQTRHLVPVIPMRMSRAAMILGEFRETRFGDFEERCRLVSFHPASVPVRIQVDHVDEGPRSLVIRMLPWP